MIKEYPVLLAVHPVASAFMHMPEERRMELIGGLRQALAAGGLEAKDSSAELLLFNYGHPLNAVTVLFEHLDEIRRQQHEWLNKAAPLPLQYILHLEKRNEPLPSFRNLRSSVWDQLAPDTLHLSRPMKMQWENRLQGRKQVPPHQLEEGDGKFAILRFTEPAALRRKRFFPHRAQLAAGGGPACFYCGLRNHLPAACPAKQLSLESFSLPDAGYQPLPAFIRNFQTAFTNYKQLESLLMSGVDLPLIRKNPPMQAFIAFFDLLVVYQPRYLGLIAFSIHSVWAGLNSKAQVKQENRNLHMGLDCLRVGQLKQARTHLLAENQQMGGKQYCATVGLAFVALEQGRVEEMGYHLQIAASLAAVEKEKIHIALLLARYHDLAGHLWKAEQALQAVADLYADCYEIVYRRIQTEVRKGQGSQALKMIAGLIEDRLYFMNLLLDPALLPIEGLLDDLLGNHLRLAEERAEEAMAAAVEEYERLGKWIDGEEDEDFQHNVEALAKLRRQLERRSYYDLLDVAGKAKALGQGGASLQESKLDSLNGQIDRVGLEWEQCHHYWQAYPYKWFWRWFERQLQDARVMMVEARRVANESLHRADRQLAAARGVLAGLAPMVRRMDRLRLLLDGMWVFAGRLLVAELAISAVLLVLYPAVTIGLADQLGDQVMAAVRDPVIQKNVLLVANLLVAPAVAFGQTLRRVLP